MAETEELRDLKRTVLDAVAVTQKAAQTASEASQTAQQTVESVQQVARDLGVSTTQQAVGVEREAEIGKDEQWSANLKRLFDEMLGESLESIRVRRGAASRAARGEGDTDARLAIMGELGLGAIITHMYDLNAQKLRHNDLAVPSGLAVMSRGAGRILAGEPEDVVDAD